MKKFVKSFLHRGLMACCSGPIILAIIYLAAQHTSNVSTISIDQVCSGIFSLSALAFIVGGMGAIYQIERLPLMLATLIHGSVLYVSYLVTYLFNNWLKRNPMTILVFTIIYVVGYLMIWGIIYATIRKRAKRLNQMLIKKQQKETAER